MVGIAQGVNGQGLNLANLDETTQDEIDAYLTTRWRGRGPLYDQYAMSLMLDYAPDFAKLHWLAAECFRTMPSDPETYDPSLATPNSVQQLHSYMVLGWEMGIRNQFRVLRRLGFTRAQIMEIVMFGRLTAGMRGLGHVYHAIGDVLPDYADGHGNPTWPAGWAADPAAFDSGLDLNTRDLTEQDRTNLTAWYERTIGYVPNSVVFGIRYDPQVLKVHRAMWERAIKTLPKQIVPYLMLRDATLNADRDALREAALLGKAWGLTPDWIVRAITQTVQYFTGLRGMYAAYDAVDDIFEELELRRMVGVSEGLDLSNLNEITPDEVNANLMRVWSWRGPLYEMYANSLMLDYAPDFAKLHRWGSDLFGRPSLPNIVTLSMQNIHSYMMLGWETGILNEFITLRRNGMPLSQLMELVMFSQLYAGMRGLGHVYRAVGDMLPVFAEPEGTPEFPDGWSADPDAFKAGLDFSTREMTQADLKNLTDWYERTVGYLPNSVKFGLKHNPQFVKVNRAKWEVAIKTLPKQVAPYLMLRHHTITGSREGLREAALLGKSWGLTSHWLIQAVTGSAMYFTGFEGLYAAYEALDDLL